MKVSEIAFSCYPVTDVPRARAFYEGVLGLKCTMNMDMGDSRWIEYDIGGGTLSIGKYGDYKPSADGCTVALEVEDFGQAIADLKAAGVKFKMDAFETPVCHMAMVFDPDGSVIIIHKRKPGHS